MIPLGLANEKIVAISAASVRCSVATESGRVATWLDETLADVASRLEQPAQLYPEVNSERVLDVWVCLIYLHRSPKSAVGAHQHPESKGKRPFMPLKD